MTGVLLRPLLRHERIKIKARIDMFSGKYGLQTGSEYHECLISFVKSEKMNGNLSLRKYNFIACLKRVLPILIIFTGIYFLGAIYLFIVESSLLSLVIAIALGAALIIVLSILSIFPFDLQSQFDAIDGRFDDESLLRLCKHNAPDDVIDQIIRALKNGNTLSFSELYDIFWLCSRTSAGVDGGRLLAERYAQIKCRVRLRPFTKGHTE
ncbi:hypothetical protein P7V44_07810 [Providencia sp. CRE-3FA-0001]|uniref:Uncharacterized protein n=1 Tax=Providencia huashanensis TaxID=3037798 RepID=A0AA42FGJ9_9GAMM|nr:hypothetical protein [Providencia sp. CRE-3FA-0001]MDG4696146.1 hypothetical protein [Providencia sp. CRE-3FA-0001]